MNLGLLFFLNLKAEFVYFRIYYRLKVENLVAGFSALSPDHHVCAVACMLFIHALEIHTHSKDSKTL